MNSILSPAYGRDYKTPAEVLDAWRSGKDFLLDDIGSPQDGKPINQSKATDARYVIRYKKLRQSVIVIKDGNDWKLD